MIENIEGFEIKFNENSKRIINIDISDEILNKLIFPFNKFDTTTLEYKPFVFDPERDVLITTEVIRRYTMKDIGDLENRLTNVEYYTSLSMLESQAENTKTYDENGFDRLKNGYVVDDFTDHTTGDVLSPDYKCSLDFREGQLRPQHYTTNVALQYNAADSTSVGISKITATGGNALVTVSCASAHGGSANDYIEFGTSR